ncbi:unnamed protein product [Closterium sp. NIES-64]|nr:unnamed protein product [Closterium sp. NIES-64]
MCPALTCPALTCPALMCPALTCPALMCPALTCPALTCPALTCPALTCPALTFPALTCSACSATHISPHIPSIFLACSHQMQLPHHADQMQRMRCRPHLPPYSLHLSHMLPSNASSPSCRLDAAHAVPPTLGQGSSLAIEDALELARQVVADHPSLECVV